MTEYTPRVRQIDPKWAWVAIAVAAVVGAVVIFTTSSMIHRRDRLAIDRWEQVAYTQILLANEIHGRLPDIEERVAAAPSAIAGRGVAEEMREIQEARTTVQRVRRAIESADTPEIMLTTAQHLYSAVGLTLEAITLLEREVAAVPVGAAERKAFRQAWTRADTAFTEGRSALLRVRCRARIPNCEAIPTD